MELAKPARPVGKVAGVRPPAPCIADVIGRQDQPCQVGQVGRGRRNSSPAAFRDVRLLNH